MVTALNNKDAKGVYWVGSDNIAFPSNGALWMTGDLTIYSAVSTLVLPPVVLNKTGGPVQLSIIVLNGISAPTFTVPANVKTLLYGGTGNIIDQHDDLGNEPPHSRAWCTTSKARSRSARTRR